MGTERNQALDYAQNHIERFIEELQDFLRIPSVAARGEGIDAAVSWLDRRLSSAGLTVEVINTTGNPVVVAEAPKVAGPTILFYGHYDVQPEDPIEEWEYPPFDAQRDGDRIYARGAVDNKGNFLCIVNALESYYKTAGGFPCNIKVIVEGEEEIGSPSLPGFMAAHKDRLKADAMVWFDSGIHPDGRPEICLGMKGLLYTELHVRTNSKDLHSGKATLVPNAAIRLVHALASLVGENNEVKISGFYDECVPPNDWELDQLENADLSAAALKEKWGVEHFHEKYEKLPNAKLFQHLLFDPTCTIGGITAGYQGEGSKTVIPSKASAKVEFRLVPNQDPAHILQLLKEHLAHNGFGDVEVRLISAMKASKPGGGNEIADLLAGVMANYYRYPLVKPLVEGSGPGVVFEEVGAPYVFSRLGPPEDRSHAPNEYFTVPATEKGTAIVIDLIAQFARQYAQQ